MLTLDYRPTTFSDVVGQSHVTAVLRAFALRQALPAACLLFAGERATGKTSTARIMAAALNCTDFNKGDACGQCASCTSIQDGYSPAVIEIDAASHGHVEDVHRLRDVCLYAPQGNTRVVIIDEAQSLTKEAQAAFLKMLEEPPADTLFLLLTTHPEQLTKPVRSRTMPFDFRPIPDSLVVQRLAYIAQREELAVPADVLPLIAQYAEGHMREAVTRLEQAHLAGVTSPDEYEKIFSVPDVSYVVLDAITQGHVQDALAHVRKFFEMSADMRVLAQNVTEALVHVANVCVGGQGSPHAQIVAQRVSRERVISALHVVWDFSGRVQWAPNDRSVADLLVVMLGKVLVPEVMMNPDAEAKSILTEESEYTEEDALAYLKENGLL